MAPKVKKTAIQIISIAFLVSLMFVQFLNWSSYGPYTGHHFVSSLFMCGIFAGLLYLALKYLFDVK